MATRRNASSARLRATIDKGDMADKVRVLDPAAAPLGTDAEAAGTPTPAAAVEDAFRDEPHGIPGKPNGRALVSSAFATLIYLATLGILMWAILT